MTKIKLTQGKIAIIDDEDKKRIKDFKWCVAKIQSMWYAYAYVRGTGRKNQRMVALHRFIMNCPKGLHVDHKNSNGLDCRKKNMRICTPGQNRRNLRLSKRNKSGYKGVFFWKYKKLKRPWVSTIVVNSKNVHLGMFPTAIKAAKAYNVAAKKYFGEFARLNPV